MTAGRKCIPTAIKRAKGTLKKCRTNELEPRFSLIQSLPDPPEHFTEQARTIYSTTGLTLINQGILTGVSLAQFVNYCYITGEVMNLQKEIETEGRVIQVDGKKTISPYVKILNQYIPLSRQLASDFGLSPATVSKVSTTIKKEVSALEEFFT